jgi:hypothetical protein
VKKKMTKAELAKKVYALENNVQPGDYELGSAWQQKHANLVKQYVTSYPNSTLTDDETAALIFALNEDVQVRDFAIGLITPTDKCYQAWFTLMSRAPRKYQSAQACLASNVRYEQGLKPEAIVLLAVAKESYPLAQLLKRVYAADWSADGFANMRKQLHPKVVESIYGLQEANQ